MNESILPAQGTFRERVTLAWRLILGVARAMVDGRSGVNFLAWLRCCELAYMHFLQSGQDRCQQAIHLLPAIDALLTMSLTTINPFRVVVVQRVRSDDLIEIGQSEDGRLQIFQFPEDAEACAKRLGIGWYAQESELYGVTEWATNSIAPNRGIESAESP